MQNNGHPNGHAKTLKHPPGAWGKTDEDRLPPQDLNAEKALLGSMVWDNAKIGSVLEIIGPQHLWRSTHQIVFREIETLWRAGKPVDGVTLSDALEAAGQYGEVGGDDFLYDITRGVFDDGTLHVDNALAYAEIIRKKWMARTVHEINSEVLRRINTQEDVPPDTIDEMIRTLESVRQDDDEEEIDLTVLRPDPIDEAAYYGILGQIVRKIAPLTEADPAAMLGQMLVCMGSALGFKPHWRANATSHRCNLYLAVVGRTSRARKGTGWDFCFELMEQIDRGWSQNCIERGMVSGEGFLERIRDARFEKVKIGGSPKLGGGGYQEVMVDPGIDDKRVLWIEEEFGGVLTAKGREHSVLGDKIKVMWGKGTDSSSSRNRPVRVTDGHVSVIGHITMKELVKKLSDIDMASGFGNRFLWLYSERKQLLPRGAPLRLKNFEIEMAWLRECLQWSSEADWSVPISMTSEAWDLWESEGLYAHLGRPRPGVLDELTARAEPQVRRIAIIFALLEKETVVSRQHLEAAHAFWDYCERTAAAIWGCAPEHETDTKILAALRLMPDGMSKTELTRKVFSGHISGDDLSKSLAGLLRACLIKQKKIKKHGRSAVVFCLA